ncbi:MAG: lytic transglycosylase domain-containing protein [Pseudomonadota bacterium]
MTRITALAVVWLCICVITLTSAPQVKAQAGLSRALDAVRQADWEEARRSARQDGQIAQDIVLWHRLRAGFGTYNDVLDFLDRRADWPGLAWLKRKTETSFAAASNQTVLAYFMENPPQTAEGFLIHARALSAIGETGEAEASLVLAWRTLPMGSAVQSNYLSRYRALLAPHHGARIDRMLWDNHLVSARRMLPLVSEDTRKLAEARIALIDAAPGVDARIAAVPETLKTDPGLAFDRFVWRDRKGRDKDAIDLLLDRSVSAEALGLPDKWGNRRRVLARQEMRAGKPNRAYEIAARHFMSPEDGYVYADLEWLAGFIALRLLDDPATALRHFERFDAAVMSPISKGRGGYWIGRAHAALGDGAAAQAAYARAAGYQTSFYGLLAAEQADVPFDMSLVGQASPPDWQEAGFTRSSVFQAGMLLIKAGDAELAERFITHLAESLDTEQAAQLGEAALSMNRPHLAVMIGKRVAQRGVVIPRAYYAVHPVGRMELPMAPEMTLAIARRESEFDPRVVSGAGARGLMQVMPGTGRDVARDLGILSSHNTGRLTSEWRYNAKLGTNYLAGLADRFNGNVILMSAGYNAGPGRPTQWMGIFGDPRGRSVDMIDWIEFIPFRETRNYVMRVTESLPVYRARLGLPAHPIPFTEELNGSTLRAFAP